MTYILFNPLANGGHGTKGLETVQAAFAAEAAESIDITTLDTGAFLTSLTGEDKVILCGGDGTIHRLVNSLAGAVPAVPIYVWRFGTGNDFLRDTALKSDDRVLLNSYIRNLPRADFNGTTHRFLNGCSLGVDAVVCAMMEENRLKPKKSGYVMTAVQAIFRRFQPMSGRVTVDGVTREYKSIWMAGTMNGHYQGGGMNFAPDQDRNGTWLCSMVWHDTSALGTLLRFPTVLVGAHTRFKPICDIRFGHHITVELDQPTTIQMDGEVTEGVRSYTAHKE